MLVSSKGGLETTGGMGAPLFSLSRRFAYLLHWQALSESVSVIQLSVSSIWVAPSDS
jgi:hypothetical protein